MIRTLNYCYLGRSWLHTLYLVKGYELCENTTLILIQAERQWSLTLVQATIFVTIEPYLDIKYKLGDNRPLPW